MNIKRVSGLIIFLILLSACSHIDASNISATPTTIHISPTSTSSIFQPIYTLTQTGSPTEIINPTKVSSSSPTPSTINEDTKPTQISTPTPTSTSLSSLLPAKNAEAYRLKKWNETDGWNQITAMESYAISTQDEQEMFYWHFPDIELNHSTVLLAAQENALLFQDNREGDQFTWRYLLGQSLGYEDKTTKDILTLIENRLNEGVYNIQSLSQTLQNFRFDLRPPLTINNLFGDGKDVLVYHLSTEFWDDGIIFALSGEKIGGYKITLIGSQWDYSWSWYEDLRSGDYNSDGIPEVLVVWSTHNGTFCSEAIHLFQWNGEEFVDLTINPRDPREISADTCSSSWRFRSANDTGTSVIEVYDPAHWRLGIFAKRVFKWNGSFYEFQEREIMPPRKLESDTYVWLDYGINDENFQLVEELLYPEIADWENDKISQDELFQLGPSYGDYLRFQAGYVSALQGNFDKARDQFNQLISNPINPITNTISIAADAFLQNYQSEIDIYRACQSAIDVMSVPVSQFRDEYNSYPYEQLISSWGYYPAGENESICDLRSAMRTLTGFLGEVDSDHLLERLLNAGVPIRKSAQLDLDGDGTLDWLIVVDTPGSDSLFEPWTILGTGSNYKPLALIDFPSKRYVYQDSISSNGKFNINVEYLDDEISPIVFLQIGKYFFVFDVLKQGQDDIAIRRWGYSPFGGVLDYFVRRNDSSLMLDLAFSEYVGDRWILDDDYLNFKLRVDPSTQKLILIDKYNPIRSSIFKSQRKTDPLLEVLDKAKIFIFVENNYQEALSLLLESITYAYGKNNSLERDEILYLIGLTYQMLGSEEDAVRAYWKLWENSPESPYTIMAKMKLEIIE